MIQDSKLLSICIPTYNGAKYIRENLDIMIKQIQENNLSDVEIVVSDNCSTDSIPQIMSEYVTKYPDIIRYSRNDKNLGYDGNVMKLMKLAVGKYIHLFGDDDYFAPNGLIRLHNVLKNNPDLSILVLSNFYHRNDNYNEIVSRKGLQEVFSNKDRIYINDSDNFIIDVEDRAWPNTNIVFKKECFEQIPNIQRFYKTDWIHLYIMLYIAQKWQNCYLFADKYPIIIDRVGVQTWLNNVDGPRIYFNNLWTYGFAKTLGYSPRVFEWYRKKLLFEYIKNIRYRRSHNIFVNLKYLIKYFKYWKDLPDFYQKFIPEFLKPIQSLFSVTNESINYKKNKVLTILGKRYYLKETKQRTLKFAHKFKDSEIIVIQNDKGNLKQFIPGSFYSEMVKTLKYLDKFNFIPKDFLKRIDRFQYKKLIPYSAYIGDCFYYDDILYKIDRKSIPQATGVLRQYQLETLDFCYDKVKELEQETGIKAVLFYGSLLGALFHDGFIPWDEDMDFVLMRADYEAAIDYFTSKYYTVNSDDWNWNNYMHKIVETLREYPNKDFCFKMPNCFKIINGTVSNFKVVDIFSLDYYKKEFEDAQFKRYVRHIVNLRNRTTTSFKEMFKFTQNVLNKKNAIVNDSDKIYYGVDNYTFHCYPYNKYFLKSEMFPLKEHIFENKKFYIPNKSDNILAKIYKNYEQLPPVIESMHIEEAKRIDEELLADLRKADNE